MNPNSIAAFILVRDSRGRPPGRSEQIMVDALRAAATDLARLLLAHEVRPVVIAAPSTDWVPAGLDVICDDDPAPAHPTLTDAPQRASFHFGQRLAGLIDRYAPDGALCFGGGSAPLLDQAAIGMLVGLIGRAQDGSGSVPPQIALTNSRARSGWVAVSDARAALPVIRQTASSDDLAGALHDSGECEVRVLSSMRPATGLDIEATADLAILARHPGVQPALRGVIQSYALDTLPAVDRLITICRRPQQALMLIGRVSPGGWQALGRAARCQVLTIAEPELYPDVPPRTRSTVAPWVRARWWDGFFADLGLSCDGIVFDNRPVLQALGLRAALEEIQAVDFPGREPIDQLLLRDLRAAADHAPLPILMGGRSLVTGGLYVLAEILAQGGTTPVAS